MTDRGDIRNEQSYKQAKLMNHSKLAGVFRNPKITPSDIDFCVDDDGFFLVGEFKRDFPTRIDGQRILARNLVKTMQGQCHAFLATHEKAPSEKIDTADCNVHLLLKYDAVNKVVCESTLCPPVSVLSLCKKWTEFNRKRRQGF